MKISVPQNSQLQDKFIPVPYYTFPQTRSTDDSTSRTLKRKIIQDASREIPVYVDPIYKPPPRPTEISLQEIPRKLTDIDMNMDFKENPPYQEGVISETYLRPDRSYFQEPPELESLVSTGKLVQRFN